MASNTPVFDLTLEQKLVELALLGFEKEAMHPSMDSSALSRLLANARINPRPNHAGLLILSCKETIDMLRPKLIVLDVSLKSTYQLQVLSPVNARKLHSRASPITKHRKS